MPVELAVTVKDDEKTYRQKFLLYTPFTMGISDDPTVKKCVEEALTNFQGQPDDVTVRTTMVWQ